MVKCMVPQSNGQIVNDWCNILDIWDIFKVSQEPFQNHIDM